MWIIAWVSENTFTHFGAYISPQQFAQKSTGVNTSFIISEKRQ